MLQSILKLYGADRFWKFLTVLNADISEQIIMLAPQFILEIGKVLDCANALVREDLRKEV